jgi:hypothetical protein
MKYAKVEGHVNLMRDQNTNAILNTNMTEYEKYISMRDTKNNENQRMKNIEDEVSGIKSDLNEIKNLLKNLAK